MPSNATSRSLQVWAIGGCCFGGVSPRIMVQLRRSFFCRARRRVLHASLVLPGRIGKKLRALAQRNRGFRNKRKPCSHARASICTAGHCARLARVMRWFLCVFSCKNRPDCEVSMRSQRSAQLQSRFSQRKINQFARLFSYSGSKLPLQCSYSIARCVRRRMAQQYYVDSKICKFAT